jgi:hypothetical protein
VVCTLSVQHGRSRFLLRICRFDGGNCNFSFCSFIDGTGNVCICSRHMNPRGFNMRRVAKVVS